MATQVSLTLKTPWQLIVDEINQLNADTGASFQYSDLKYVLKEKNPSAPEATLTLSPGEGTPYFNERDVTYHRLDLANIIKVTNLGNLTYVDEGDGTKTSARLLTYPLDFSTYTAGLQAITSNETKIDESLAGNLTTLIKEQTGVSDDIINELKTNLQTATFVYNGVTTGSTDKGVNATYNHVLVLSLANGTHTYGKAVFGYNVSE